MKGHGKENCCHIFDSALFFQVASHANNFENAGQAMVAEHRETKASFPKDPKRLFTFKI